MSKFFQGQKNNTREKEGGEMKRTLVATLLIGLCLLLGYNAAYADYASIFSAIFGTKVAEANKYASDLTTLISVTDKSDNETIFYSGGKQQYMKGEKGNLVSKFVWDGAILKEEWMNFGIDPATSGKTHSTWLYKNGVKDWAKNWAGDKIADSVTWQDLISDGYYGKTDSARTTYLKNLLGTVTDADVAKVKQYLNDAKATLVINQNFAFSLTYQKNFAGTGVFANTITHYNEQNKQGDSASLDDKTLAAADPAITGTIMKDGVGGYYLQTSDGTRIALTKGNTGSHDVSQFSVWLGNTTDGVGRSLTVNENGQWVTIDSTNAAKYGITVENIYTYLANNVGKSVTLIGDLSTSGVLYVNGVAAS